MNASISRRDLVSEAALGGAALAAAAMLPAAALAENAPVADTGSFDTEYDVVVLGMGGAGMCAAIAAYEEGAKVLLCEKAPAGQEPCNTKVAGQVILSTDDSESFYTYLKQLMGKFTNYDDETLRAFAEGAAENWDWMTKTLGGDPELMYPVEDPAYKAPGGYHFEQKESFWDQDRPGYVYVWDEFPEFEGHEHSIILTFSGRESDSSYYFALRDNIASREGDRLEVWLGAPGTRLITSDEGIVGVIVNKDGKDLRVRANGGVVLATGGFESNRAMLSTFAQLPYAYPFAAALNTGDGVNMAAGVGAQLWHMSNMSGLGFAYHNPERVGAIDFNWNTNFIIVGPAGGRFMNELSRPRHGRVSFGGAWNMTPMAMPAYLVTDSTQISESLVPGFSEGNVDEIASGAIISGQTIEELSANIRAAGAAPQFNLNGELDNALARFNAHAAAGEEDDFGRGCDTPLETGPFYALELCPSMLNTQGGPRHNGLAQVLDTASLPIEGLFSCGELGSIFPDMYNGGGNLGETMIFGRIAGRNAAHRAQGTFEGATEPALLWQEELDAAAAAAKANEPQTVLTGEDLADGVYTGEGKGFSSKIVLQVTVEGGQFTACEVLESAETPELGEMALPAYCEGLVETQDANLIDVASGATNTLNGFRLAVAQIVEQAGA